MYQLQATADVVYHEQRIADNGEYDGVAVSIVRYECDATHLALGRPIAVAMFIDTVNAAREIVESWKLLNPDLSDASLQRIGIAEFDAACAGSPNIWPADADIPF